MESFQEKYNKGILSKLFFMNSTITLDFISWLVPFISGENKLVDLGFDFNNFNDAILSYKWGKGKLKEKFEDTYIKFGTFRTNLRSSNEPEIINTCLEILRWGGVLAHNEEKIKRRIYLKEFLSNINNFLSQEEIIIDDLNPNHINSGYTKIYSALNENFIIYDGRVGAALCYLIRKYLESRKEYVVPAELIFGWGIGQGKKQRDPSSNVFKFKEITANRDIHFISNIKANWLLESIAKNQALNLLNTKEYSKRIFALQTALFVLGEKLPT